MKDNYEKFAALFARSVDIVTTQERTYTIMTESFDNADISSTSSSSSSCPPFRIRLAIDIWNKEVFIDVFFVHLEEVPCPYPSPTFHMMLRYIIMQIEDTANHMLSALREKTNNFAICFPGKTGLYDPLPNHWVKLHSKDSGHPTTAYLRGELMVHCELKFYEKSYDDVPVTKQCVVTMNTLTDKFTVGTFLKKVYSGNFLTSDLKVDMKTYQLTYVGSEMVFGCDCDNIDTPLERLCTAKFPNCFRLSLEDGLRFVCDQYFFIGIAK